MLDELDLAQEDVMQKFSQEILDLVNEQTLTHIEQMQVVCEKYDVDPSDVNTLISPALLERIYDEAKSRNLIKKTGVSIVL